MRFKVNTKPLVDSLSLGIIPGNINRFDAISTSAQITGTEDYLKINLEAGTVKSEIILNGIGEFSDEDDAELGNQPNKKLIRLVDNSILKQLVASFETSITEFEFVPGGLILYSGKSKFSLPQLQSGGFELDPPSKPEAIDNEIDIIKDNWMFIEKYQTYALAMTFTRPAYSYIFMNDNNDVIAGDADNSLFTHSKKSNLSKQCLVSDNIVNLLQSLPDGAKLVEHDGGYIVSVDADGYSFVAEFTPKYESDPEIGNYQSQIFLDMMTIPNTGFGSFDASAVIKFILQLSLLSTSTQDSVLMKVSDNQLTIIDREDNKCDFNLRGDCPDFEISFKLSLLKDILSNYDVETLCICPVYNEQSKQIGGVLVWSDELTTVLGGFDA